MIYFIFLVLFVNYLNGEFCQRDDCRGGDCELTQLNNGTMKKFCHCVKGVCGENCQRLCNVTSQCETNPCWFGGTCVDIANTDYVCLCEPNFTGKDCRTAISCRRNICQNSGVCVQTGSATRCECSENSRGEFCQYQKSTKLILNIPQAEPEPIDQKTFEDLSGMGSASASFHPNLQRANNIAIAIGNRSQFVFCLTNPCENGGTCFVTNAATTKGICVCPNGFAGDYCENLYNASSNGLTSYGGFCSSNPCLNDGSCVELNHFNGYCRCTPEFRGIHCEMAIRNQGCNPNPCKNGGTCVLLDNNQARCLCTPVFRGLTCNQFSYVPCGEATCHGTQGTCLGSRCVCKTGFAGPRCDSTDFCAAYPCQNGGTCVRIDEEPYGGCSCPSEFSGPTCSNDPCSPSPCLNGGVCIRKSDNQFYCQCRHKNRGVYCEQAECFPEDALVDVLDIGPKLLSSIKIGTKVRVINEQNQIEFSPIIAFLHRDLDEHGLYKQIRTKTSQIELSKRHLIQRRVDGFVWAENLKENDEILVVSSNKTIWEKIIQITEIDKKGLLAPLTEQGTVVVNNVHASCYALVKYHSLGHIALAPFRWYYKVFGQISDLNSTPILGYANYLLEFIQNLPFARDFIF